jgi:two-component system sensor histidine kinase RegB
LIKLRWGAVLTQALLVIAVDRTTVSLPVVPLLAMLAAVAASNGLLFFWSRRRADVAPRVLGLTLAFDVAVLTAMLALTGGSLNPFTSLYLVHIALAAVVLDARWIWTLVALSAAGFALLFVRTPRMSDADHAKHMQIHLQGMWIAFTFSALFIGYFVSRVQSALVHERRELERARAREARNEKLAALATLAAGAAHELATPLSTIAVVAKELDLRLRKTESDPSLIEDAALIRQEVARCRAVLDQLSADAGLSTGEQRAKTTLAELVQAATSELSVEIDLDSVGDTALQLPSRATVMALRGLLKNAQDASEGESVHLKARRESDRVAIEIVDRGPGMDAATLARIGEPFFTTKPPGKGMGLGVFVARSVIEHVGGELRYDSSPAGTRATVTLPAPGG